MALSRARSSGASGRDAQHTAVYAFSFSSEPSCMPLYASLSDTCNPVAVTTPSSADSSAASISASASADTTGDLGLCTSRMNGRPPPSMRTSMSSRPALFSLHPSARIRDETTASSDVCTEPSPTTAPSANHGDCGTPRAHFKYRPPTYTG